MLRNLRDFGFGKSTMEDLFHDEVTNVIKLFMVVYYECCDQDRVFVLASHSGLV